MVNFWVRMNRVAPTLTESEREAQMQARAGWADLLQQRIAISPTLDDETRTRRAERARQIVYANERRERARQASRAHVATSQSHRPHHHLKGGGTV
jgi:hypothetical protein